MKSRKVGYLPGKAADPAKIQEQEQFRLEELEPRLAAGATHLNFRNQTVKGLKEFLNLR